MVTKLTDLLSQIVNHLERLETSSQVWLTPEGLAKYLGLSVHTIYQYVSSGNIPFYKIPGSSKLLFHRGEIDSWIHEKNSRKEKRLDVEKIVEDIWEKI